MQKNYNCRRFTCDNTRESLLSSLNLILAYIGETIENSDNSNNIMVRSKWVLTELLTNAARHANNDLICFEICFDCAVLEITKVDYGEPFSILISNQRKPFPFDFDIDKRYVIQKDDLSVLYATVSNEGALIFEADDVEMFEDAAPDLSEHFGLIIITRSSDKFTYTYDKFTKTNVFSASFRL